MRRVLGEPDGRSPMGTEAEELTVDELVELEVAEYERQERADLLRSAWRNGDAE